VLIISTVHFQMLFVISMTVLVTKTQLGHNTYRVVKSINFLNTVFVSVFKVEMREKYIIY